MKISIVISVLLGTALFGQDRITVPFSDPSRPKTLHASLLNGSITVRGYDGKDVIIETKTRGGEEGRQHGRSAPDGMHRIENTSFGLTAEEENNVVRISAGVMRTLDIVVQVPRNTSLNLRCVNDGNIDVENVSGDLDVNDLNGGVRLRNVSGSVVAHSLNQNVTVTFDRIDASKPMSFSSLNGDIDVTFPAEVKANIKMKTDNGDIFSDFDVKMDASKGGPQVEDGRKNGGRYKVKIDKSMYGTINGGGPEFQFTTFNGKIFIRKKK